VDLSDVLTPEGDLTATFTELLGSPNLASKRWLHEQYDTSVRTSTVVRPGSDAGVIRFRGSRRGLAATTDCNGRYCWLSPREGAKAAVAEAARNLACSGALPVAVTNNLNFGNPLKPHIYFQLREAVLGMAEACGTLRRRSRAAMSRSSTRPMGSPSFPTPVIGMVGTLDDVEEQHTTPGFKSAGDVILLLGENLEEIGGSEYLYWRHGLVAGEAPRVDLLAERRLQHAVLAVIHRGLVRSAHDLSEGGLALALAECALGGTEAFGVSVTLDEPLAPIALFFGETQGRVLLSVAPEYEIRALEILRDHGVLARSIGVVGEAAGAFSLKSPRGHIDVPISAVAHQYHETLPSLMGVRPTGDNS
jgi:phosphoribosylformylglycinamidine synthase subunit PurL